MAAKSKIGGSRKAPLGSDSPRATREGRGRTDAATTPLAVHTQGVPIRAPLEAYLHAKLGARLGKYTSHIERVTARFVDINGPRGGVDKTCRLRITSPELGALVIESAAADVGVALDEAAARAARTVARALQRRRMAMHA